MASLHSLLSALTADVVAVTTGLPARSGGTLSVSVGTDFPPLRTLQQNVRGGTALVAVFDRRVARNTTRWAPITLSELVVPATLVSTVSASTLAGGASNATITLSGTVTPGDAVSCVLSNRHLIPSGTFEWAVVVSGDATDTPTTMAASLAAAINASSVLSAWVTATAVGPVVTLTSQLAGPRLVFVTESGEVLVMDGTSGTEFVLDDATTGLGSTLSVQSYTGNGATRTTELGRRARQLQIIVWASCIEDRDTVGGAIETLIAQIETFWGTSYEGGLALSDGSTARLQLVNDFQLDENTPADTYRRDFVVSADYPITSTDALYAVLAVVTQYQLGYI